MSGGGAKSHYLDRHTHEFMRGRLLQKKWEAVRRVPKMTGAGSVVALTVVDLQLLGDMADYYFEFIAAGDDPKKADEEFNRLVDLLRRVGLHDKIPVAASEIPVDASDSP